LYHRVRRARHSPAGGAPNEVRTQSEKRFLRHYRIKICLTFAFVSKMHYICSVIEIKMGMNFIDFKEQFFDLGCFSTQQVFAWHPDFDRNNLLRWARRGRLIRLRQGYFAFTEYLHKPDFALYIANRIYRPSYISLHTALSFYGMIPEAVVQITSVTSLKTMFFENSFGEYSYKSIKRDLMFGYEPHRMFDDRTLMLASPEKALLDLLYLYPFYDSMYELEELRLDEEYMVEDFNFNRMQQYLDGFSSTALDRRVSKLIKVYGL